VRHYETIYIASPDLSEEAYKDLLTKCSGIVEKNKGIVVKIEEWGNTRLAYVVKKYDRGSYVLLNFCGTPGLTGRLEREMKLDERVLKFQTVKLADSVDPQELIVKENDTGKQSQGGAGQQEQTSEGATKEESPPEQEVRNGNE
jgi:small subunit ribosomal protein S6